MHNKFKLFDVHLVWTVFCSVVNVYTVATYNYFDQDTDHT